MNYLAHMMLSFDQEDILIGNLSGDFVSIAEYRFLKGDIKAGVDLHRSIDHYTDNHEYVIRSISRLKNEHGRYAAVIVDILYDYLLATMWDNFVESSLDNRKVQYYDILTRRHADLPKRLQNSAPKMVSRDFIEGYKTLNGMRHVMGYMDRRTSFPSDFVSSVDYFEKNIEAFTDDFKKFFPDLITHTQQTLTSLQEK